MGSGGNSPVSDYTSSALMKYRDVVLLVCIAELVSVVVMFSFKPCFRATGILLMYAPIPLIVISLAIGIYFLYRALCGSAKATSLSLGLSYILYAFPLFWLILYMGPNGGSGKLLGFILLQGLILFLALNFYGIARGLIKRFMESIILLFIIIACGNIVLITALIISDALWALYAINFILLVPLSFVYIYVFWIIGKQTRFLSSKILLVSWLLFPILHSVWIVMANTILAIIFLELLILPLSLMFVGYAMLGLEIKINVLMEEIEMLRS